MLTVKALIILYARFNLLDTHFEQNRINWLHLRFSLNIYVWVGGAFSLIYYVTSRQNSLCKLIWSFFNCLATSKHHREDFLSRPPLPTHLSMIIMLCCMLLLNCSSGLRWISSSLGHMMLACLSFPRGLKFASASFCIICHNVTSCYSHL